MTRLSRKRMGEGLENELRYTMTVINRRPEGVVVVP